MRILVQPYTHTLSHISRPLLIAHELRARGHEIIFAGESAKTRFISAHGYPVVPCHEPDPDILYTNIREGKLRFVDDREIDRMLDADLALYGETKPDLVLSDGRFTAPVSTQLARLRHAAIVNVSSTEYRALPYIPLFEAIPSWIAGKETALQGLLDQLNLRIEMFVFDNVMSIFKRLSRRHRLATTVTATNCLTGIDLTLLADIPEYFPTRNLPSSYHYIGPLTWKQRLEPPPWWPLPPDERPLIYVTMGTTGVEDFFARVQEFFGGSSFRIIISTGGQTRHFTSNSDNIFITDYIDGDMVMEACDLVVCHGGNGTVYQALQHGKPIIGIPTIPDQKFNMRRVEAIGVGTTLTLEKFNQSPESFLQLVKSTVEHRSFTENAARFRNILSSYDAARSAAELIEKLV